MTCWSSIQAAIPLVRHPHPEAIPAPIAERHVLRRLVLGRILAVDARQSHHGSRPTPGDPRTMARTDRKCQPGKEVDAIYSHGLETDLVIRFREIALIGDSCQHLTELQQNPALLPMNLAFAAEVRHGPTFQSVGIE
jgi:hypothetical protein